MKMVKIDKKIGFLLYNLQKLKILTKKKCERNISMTFRGHSKKYSKIRINKTKGRERYGTFNRDSVRRAELRDGVYDPDIRRNTGKRVGRSYLDHHGGNRRTLYHICPKLERRKSGKGSAFIGIRNRKRTGLL